MVEIEAAEKILVCLAVAAMLGDDYPRHGFEHFSGTAYGAVLQLLGSYRALGRGLGNAQHAVPSFLHHYLGQLGCPLLSLGRSRGRSISHFHADLFRPHKTGKRGP